jgi:tRNA pseudouridine38-40 synthase
VLEYDGSSFHGWQSQRSRDSVQDAVEAALSTIAGGKIRVIAAGRTDAGVHALYQVLHFDTQEYRLVSRAAGFGVHAICGAHAGGRA